MAKTGVAILPRDKKFDQINSEIWNIVKSDIGCDVIIFKLNEEILFEL